MPLVESILDFIVNATTNTSRDNQQFIDGSRTAQRHYLTPSEEEPSFAYSGLPRPKFLFGVRFNRNHSTPRGTKQFKQEKQSLAFSVKYIDRPKVNFGTEELNQYNRTRLVHTKVTYEPVTLRFHDTVDNRALNFFYEYFKFYYGDARQTSIRSWANDILKQDGMYGSEFGWGLTPLNLEDEFSSFFSTIDLFHFYGQKFNKIQLINPKIVSFDHDSNDFEAGTTGTEITMQLKFEGILYDSFSQDLTDDLIKEFELGYNNMTEIPGYSGAGTGGVPLGGINAAVINGAKSAFKKFALPQINSALPNNSLTPRLLNQATDAFFNSAANSTISPTGSGLSTFRSLNFGSSLSTSSGPQLTNLTNRMASSISGNDINPNAISPLTTANISKSAKTSSFNQALSTLRGNSDDVNETLAGVVTEISGVTGKSVSSLVENTSNGTKLSNEVIAGLNGARAATAQQGIATAARTDSLLSKAISADTV